MMQSYFLLLPSAFTLERNASRLQRRSASSMNKTWLDFSRNSLQKLHVPFPSKAISRALVSITQREQTR